MEKGWYWVGRDNSIDKGWWLLSYLKVIVILYISFLGTFSVDIWLLVIGLQSAEDLRGTKEK